MYKLRVGETCINHMYMYKSEYVNLGSGASNLSTSGNDILVNDTPECG